MADPAAPTQDAAQRIRAVWRHRGAAAWALWPLSQLYREFADVIMSERLHELYAEQIREENARDGTSKSEKFPVPNVKDGDFIIGEYVPGSARFYFNGRLLGEVADADFARLFFGIWLDAKTSAPELRAALLRRVG